MADDDENLQGDDGRRSHERESRSVEETEGRTPDLKPSESGRRSGDERRQEIESKSLPKKKRNEYSGLRISERGQIHESDAGIRENLQQQRRRDVEMRHETERDRSMDRRGKSESRWRFDERSQGRHEQVQHRNYGSGKDCPYYLKTGRCGYGESCIHNHPTHRRQENEEFGLRINKRGPIRDRKYSDEDNRENLRQQKLRDVDMRHETESGFWQQKKDRRGGSESRWRFDERIDEEMQYQKHGRAEDCPLYLKNGPCPYEYNCRYIHPEDLRDKSSMETCKSFLRGDCELGSTDMDDAEPMRHQARTTDWNEGRFDERTLWRHETESRYRAEKKTKTISDFQESDWRQREFGFERERRRQEQRPRERFTPQTSQLIDGIVKGYKEATIRRISINYKENLQEDIEKQRREAQDNLQEQSEEQRREAHDNLPEQSEEQRREAQENLQQQRLRGMPENQNADAHDQQNPREHIHRVIDLNKPTVEKGNGF